MARGERVYHVTAPLLPKGPISKRRCRSVCTGCLFSANPVALRSAAAANRSAVHCVEVWAIRHGRLDRVSGRRGWERRSRSQGREGGEEKKKPNQHGTTIKFSSFFCSRSVSRLSGLHFSNSVHAASTLPGAFYFRRDRRMEWRMLSFSLVYFGADPEIRP